MRKIPLQTRRPGTKYNMDAEDLCLGAHDLGKCFAKRYLSLRAYDFDIAIRYIVIWFNTSCWRFHNSEYHMGTTLQLHWLNCSNRGDNIRSVITIVARCDWRGNAIARCDWHGNAIARCDWRGNARSITSFDAQCCDAEEYTMEL